jgi:hypothetical protein
MAGEDPRTPREWALLCLAQYGRSEEYQGQPFPGLVDYIALAIQGAVAQRTEACAAIADDAPLAPDTVVGTRQRMVKAHIAATIRGLEK